MIKVKNLTKIYRTKKKKDCLALNDISFELPDKGLVFIVGKSGSGKSTLLNILGGLDNHTSGEVCVFGNEIHNFDETELYDYRSSMCGFIFQDFHLIDQLTIYENITLGLKLLNEEDNGRISEVLKAVDLAGYEERYPTELSGGEKQRIAIARALVKNPNVILADEPTGNLDSNTTKQVINLIKEISKEKLVIIVSHNLYDAYEYADRIIELSHGNIINDLEANTNYSNSVHTQDDKLIIPLLKKFSDDELDNILEECKKDNVKKIVQDNTKFIKAKDYKYNDNEIEIKHNNIKLSEMFKLSYIFGKNKLFNFLLSSLICAIIIVVISLSQSISYYDQTKTLLSELQSSDSLYALKKDSESAIVSGKLIAINNDDIASLNENSNSTYYLSNLDNVFALDNGYIIREREPKIEEKIFYTETLGTLVTTEEYAKKLLKVDELKIYTNNIEYKPSGVYITDYFADSMMYYNGIEEPNKLLGLNIEDAYWNWGYINGIIYTGYKEKYKDIIKEFSIDNTDVSPEILEFYDYITKALAVSYSFEENFKEYATNDIVTKNFNPGYISSINGIDITKNFSWYVSSDYHKMSLNDDEIFLNYIIYNNVFGTSYDRNTFDEFVPHQVTLRSQDSNGKLVFEKTVKVVGIGTVRSSTIYLSDNLFREMRKALFGSYTVYFDSIDANTIDHLIENKYIAVSMKMSAIQTMTKAVSIFNEFFGMIEAILIFGLVFVIMSFGIKNVKSYMYEIGVLKALGLKFGKLSIIFVIHILVIILFTIIFSTLGFLIFADLANEILVASLKQLAPSRIMFNIKFISFDLKLISVDNVLMIVVAILSTIIPMIQLKSIKPISIIKAKE